MSDEEARDVETEPQSPTEEPFFAALPSAPPSPETISESPEQAGDESTVAPPQPATPAPSAPASLQDSDLDEVVREDDEPVPTQQHSSGGTKH